MAREHDLDFRANQWPNVLWYSLSVIRWQKSITYVQSGCQRRHARASARIFTAGKQNEMARQMHIRVAWRLYSKRPDFWPRQVTRQKLTNATRTETNFEPTS